MGLTYALYKATRADRAMNDRDVIAGLSALARSYQRLVNTGLHYEEATHAAAPQVVIGELQTMVKEYREAEQKHTGYSRLRDSDVLKTLVFLIRMAYGRTSGRPKSRAFVDFLVTQFPEKQSALASPQEAGSRIIVP
jgi:hypothetical protein